MMPIVREFRNTPADGLIETITHGLAESIETDGGTDLEEGYIEVSVYVENNRDKPDTVGFSLSFHKRTWAAFKAYVDAAFSEAAQ